jgi:nucleoside-diphosphate-sugar epimerase
VSATRSVLITGGGGFIGKHLRPLLEQKGWNVVSVDCGPAFSASGPGCSECDITEAAQLEALFQANNFDEIIHLASILPTATQQDPHKATNVNVWGQLEYLGGGEAVQGREGPLRQFAQRLRSHPASCFVSENQPAAPEDLYGAAKRYVELLGETYQRIFGIQFSALRIAMVVGPGAISPTSPWRNQIFEFLGKAQQDEILIPYGPNEVLPLVHVEEIAVMLALLVSSKSMSNTIYNSFAESVTVRELKTEIESLNPNLRVKLGKELVRAGPRAIDSGRFATEFGHAPVPLWDRLRRAARVAGKPA